MMAVTEAGKGMNTEANTPFDIVLREQRRRAGLTQEALAERASISVRSIQALESGANLPQRDTARRLAVALGLLNGDRVRFEAAAAGAARWRLSAAPSDVPAHNLPLELTSFVGRVAEVAAVRALLAETRLLTLVGTGGVGKTRLALRVAAQVMPEFADGVWLVELASLSDQDLVAPTVAAALGLRDDPERRLLDVLIAAIVRRRMLLLLDNCEHLIGACADLAEGLLRACPYLCILVTSREALSCEGETVWRVPSLTVPDPWLTGPTAVAGSDAAHLFVERARAAQPGFGVTAANTPAVVQVCRRLDGIPLALEMAAARLRGLSIDELAARLDERFRLLAAGRRTALPRQQTLRATVEWSYGLLEEPERVLFDRLSVFAGGFSLEAAEAVCAGGAVAEPEVLELLLRLVDKSLVVVEECARGELRYRLLETLRQYGRELLTVRAEMTQMRERHAEYFLAWAEATMERYQGPEQVAALERLEATYDDVRAAFAWFLAGGAPEKSVRLWLPLQVTWVTRGYTEGRALITQLLTAPGLQPPSHERAQALRWAGGWLCHIGDPAGLALLEEALVLARRVGDGRLIGMTLYWLGHYRFDPWGDPKDAWPLLEEALALLRVLGERWWLTRCLLILGQVAGALGDHARAATLAEEALALSRVAGDKHGLTYAHEVLGEVAYARGEDAAAERLWTGCLATYREGGEPVSIATVEGDLGRLALRQGRYATARQHFTAALAILVRCDDVGMAVWGLSELAGLTLVVAMEEEHARALRLAGATFAAHDVRGFRMVPADREALDRAIALARAGLDEPAAAVAWAEGQAMTLEQAVSYALDYPEP
jgi:non-specific serine/threonine protein kinase